MAVNRYDTFHGTRQVASVGENYAKMVVGHIKAVYPDKVTADVYIPEQSSVLKDVPISFNFMNFTSGNIAFPDVDSPVIVVNAGTIKPFILCSTGKLKNYSVNSDLLENEQVFSVPALQFIKQGQSGDIISVGKDGSYTHIGKDGKISQSSFKKEDRTYSSMSFSSDIEGEAITYKSYFSIDETIYETDYNYFLNNGETDGFKEARVLSDVESALHCISDFQKNIRELSLLICEENLMSQDIVTSFVNGLSTLFDSLSFEKNQKKEVVIQEGAAINQEPSKISDISSLSKNDLENLSKGDVGNENNNRTIFKISMRADDGKLDEKFAVTEQGARIVEGNIADLFSE